MRHFFKYDIINHHIIAKNTETRTQLNRETHGNKVHLKHNMLFMSKIPPPVFHFPGGGEILVLRELSLLYGVWGFSLV